MLEKRCLGSIHRNHAMPFRAKHANCNCSPYVVHPEKEKPKHQVRTPKLQRKTNDTGAHRLAISSLPPTRLCLHLLHLRKECTRRPLCQVLLRLVHCRIPHPVRPISLPIYQPLHRPLRQLVDDSLDVRLTGQQVFPALPEICFCW